MAMDFRYLKPGQGSMTRWGAGAFLGLLILFGCHSLYSFLLGYSLWWETTIVRLPVLDFSIVWGHLVSLALAIGLLALDYVFVVNQPRTAEFLIETEAELKKVNWPPKHEFLGSSFIVILSVVIISLYLMAVDSILYAAVNKLILPSE